MKIQRWIAVCAFLSLFFGMAGCIVISSSGCSGGKTYTRTVELSEPMAEGMLLKVHTTNGSIIVQGQDTQTCAIVAGISGRAKTKERAQELAEQTQVQLVAYDEGLEAVITPPGQIDKKESICVGFNVTLPNKASLDAVSTNGRIEAVSLTGDMRANTTNGSVKFNHIQANRIDAHTTNGSISCRDVTGALNAGTTNGSVEVVFSPQAAPAVNLGIDTTNGHVSVTLPKDCSAKVEASTVNGKVKTDIPVTVSGEVSKKTLNGTISAGEGKLSLRTVNGSIEIH